MRESTAQAIAGWKPIERAERMLEQMELRNGRRVIENRRAYRKLFEDHGADALPHIEAQAPLVARAIRDNVLLAR